MEHDLRCKGEVVSKAQTNQIRARGDDWLHIECFEMARNIRKRKNITESHPSDLLVDNEKSSSLKRVMARVGANYSIRIEKGMFVNA
jgi:hypothetical protein